MKSDVLIEAKDALPGRKEALSTAAMHFVFHRPLQGILPGHIKRLLVGMGCFWGAERLFWQQAGVYLTAVGYAGGFTENPTYEEVCSGKTGHTEVVAVHYDPQEVAFCDLLTLFWQEHDPTQFMRQGADIGTNYRSALYLDDLDDLAQAHASRQAFQDALSARGFGKIVTEIALDRTFYFAEDYHQQYLAKNPNGYCGLKGIGILCPS
ncbi:peptide-methionine (S)-S-oxide reductase MsrA [Bartonella sp. DGB2]|uniref:peptide-methionine (S)-S-oxide reductase MsrA n=1 Tax=Bartonella sp. DGB2 TaxID=3388426 RepID=UPI00398FBBA2